MEKYNNANLSLINRRDFLKWTGISTSALLLMPGEVYGLNRLDLCASNMAPVKSSTAFTECPQQKSLLEKRVNKRPNILFAIADDWSWLHTGITGDPVVKTPTFDNIAKKGVLFKNAYVSSPSCTPSRAAILTGQYHWRLEENANLWSTLQAKFKVYPDVLEQEGYHTGYCRKGWGPGNKEDGGRKRNPAGTKYASFEEFFDNKPHDKPFCFWFGSTDPHRPYEWRSGVESGMDITKVRVPACLPDSEEVRIDICDYYFEVERFDREVGGILALLKEKGELNNTLVVMTGDNGMPFSRCKSNLYDLGTHVPFVVCWLDNVKGGRVVDDFISLTDVAPTFLEVVGSEEMPDMTGRSFLDILMSDKSGWIDKSRQKVITGKERHAWCRQNGVGYPCRAIRTKDYLYIKNFEPERWPLGSPVPEHNYSGKPYGDADGSVSKDYLLEHKDEEGMKKLFELAFGKRPAEELYDLAKDPEQLNNIADNKNYSKVKMRLYADLMSELSATKDPRVVGDAEKFDNYKYYGPRIGVRKN
jgi:uncharacterized sulfatase